ncbi:MAG: ACT domain-containing protein [Capsulimonadales bacterium]|nr:ACT domain-containing protein [Capsulimonadales bacterium]
MTALTLRPLPDELALCRLEPTAPFPEWARSASFFSITRTPDEWSLVLPRTTIPDGLPSLKVERDWRALMVVGPLDFALTGILASLTVPLADAGIPIFALSTFETDYLLVKAVRFAEAIDALRRQGHLIDAHL